MANIFRISLLIAFFSIYSLSEARMLRVTVSSQLQFDNLTYVIPRLFESLSIDTIRIEFGSGVFYYKEDHLSWHGADWSNRVLEIEGNPDALFIAKTVVQTCETSDDISWKNGSICFREPETHSSPYHYERWTSFSEALDTCTFAGFDGDGNVHFLSPNSSFLVAVPQPASVQFLEWYRSHIYSIATYSRFFDFYFVGNQYYEDFPDEEHSFQRVYFPNYDYYCSRRQKMPRYRMLNNPVISSRGDTVFYCTASSFADISETKLRTFSVKGMNFLCNKKEDYGELFRMCQDTVTDKIVFEYCTFSYIRGQVLYFQNSNNVVVRNNSFLDCYDNCVVSTNGSDSTIVTGNTFERCGKGMNQNFCIKCGGKDFLIMDNTIRSFSCSAIGVGCDLRNRPNFLVTGIVENNYIDNSEYISDAAISQHTLMDAGAIYTWCWNDNVTIRNNTIRNYGGVHQYRGIFCDQGTMNVTITGNTITNIVNQIWPDEQFDIDVSFREDSHVLNENHNTGNLCYGNIVESGEARINFPIDYSCHCTTFDVYSQADFDSLNANILHHFESQHSWNNILINLRSDSALQFNENHINLDNVRYPVAIKIVGNNTRLIPKTRKLFVSDFQTTASSSTIKPWQRQRFMGKIAEDTVGWSEWNYAVTPVFCRYAASSSELQIFSINTGQSSLTKSEADCKGMYLHLTEWFTSQVLPIKQITNGIIDFTAEDGAETSLAELNYDFSQSQNRLYPRYRIYETDFTKDYADAGTLLNVHNSCLAEIQVTGINVEGNCGVNPLIRSDSLSCANFTISNSTFANIKSDVIYAHKTQDLRVNNCHFQDCASNGIVSENKCLRTAVRHNTFQNIGDKMVQNFAVICRGLDFLIEDNDITNFSFGGIGVGLWYGTQPRFSITGIVRNNRISMDDAGLNDYEWKTLMGGSAIYSWTQTDGVRIVDNELFSLRGILGLHSVYGEDGAKNLTICNNTIHDIYPDKFGHRLYSIELLWSNNVASFVPDHNSNNDHWGNTYEGEEITTDLLPEVIRFERNNPDFEGNVVTSSRSERPSDNNPAVHSNFQYRYYDLYGNPVSHPTGISVETGDNNSFRAQ